MELGEAEALGVFDDHEAGGGDIHPHFDDRGGDQQIQLTGLEGVDHGVLLRGFEPPVNQADAQVGQCQAQFRGGGLGGLGLELLRILDQGAHPVGLLAGPAGIVDAGDDLGAALVGDGQGIDRGAPRGQFVDDGMVEIGVADHRQRAGDGRRGHDQLVRRDAAAALVAQGQALVDTEAMLLVDQGQA